ncbi:MAG: succinylglutamate desuccinylase/aspartoacylase family protein [Sneathiellaceae bacterium]
MSTGMAHGYQRIPLLAPAPGIARHLAVHRFGEDGARPLTYVQAGLHGDETAGPLVAHHLIRLLEAADADRRVRGEIRIVPMANPLGTDQNLLGRSIGRYALTTGENFNRRFPALSARVMDLVGENLGQDQAENVSEIRTALMRTLTENRAVDEISSLRLTLLRLALPADIALDLHGDGIEAPHLGIGTHLWPGLQDLAAEMGAMAVLLSEDSGGMPFTDALALPWRHLADQFAPELPVPADGCCAATVNLGGETMDDDEAEESAEALYRFLVHRGIVRDEVGPLPPLACHATPLDGVDLVRTPAPGIVVYHCEVGEIVRTGDLLAEVVDPTAAEPTGGRVRIYSLADGCFFSRLGEALVRPGQILGKVAGDVALPRRGANLLAP